MKLSKTELAALKDCKMYVPGHYIWKPATMKKLAGKGLAVEVENITGFCGKAHALTDAGREELRFNAELCGPRTGG